MQQRPYGDADDVADDDADEAADEATDAALDAGVEAAVDDAPDDAGAGLGGDFTAAAATALLSASTVSVVSFTPLTRTVGTSVNPRLVKFCVVPSTSPACCSDSTQV